MNNLKMLAVQQAGFALYDAMLFLDTHPQNTEALRYYNACKEEYVKASNEYEASCGPLLMYSAGGESCFDWLSMPMP